MWEQSCISPQKKTNLPARIWDVIPYFGKKYIIMIPKLSHHCSITSHCHKVFGLPAEFGYNLTLHQKKNRPNLAVGHCSGSVAGGSVAGSQNFRWLRVSRAARKLLTTKPHMEHVLVISQNPQRPRLSTGRATRFGARWCADAPAWAKGSKK